MNTMTRIVIYVHFYQRRLNVTLNMTLETNINWMQKGVLRRSFNHLSVYRGANVLRANKNVNKKNCRNGKFS